MMRVCALQYATEVAAEHFTADKLCCGMAILQRVPAFVSLRLTFSYPFRCPKLLAEMLPLDSSSGTI